MHGRYISDLEMQGQRWQGQIKIEPHLFTSYLAEHGAKLTTLSLSRPSLEEFFIDQLQQRGIRHST
jgi:ABC-2 type transport system ATP-binding protein